MTNAMKSEKELKVKRAQVLRGGLVQHVLDRDGARKAGIPDTFAPSAPILGLMTDDNASGKFLYLVHPDAMWGTRRWNWVSRQGGSMVFARGYDDRWLRYWVGKYSTGKSGFGQLWTAERELGAEKTNHEVLALCSVPLLFNKAWVAKDVAQACNPQPRKEAARLSWLPVTIDSREIKDPLMLGEINYVLHG